MYILSSVHLLATFQDQKYDTHTMYAKKICVADNDIVISRAPSHPYGVEVVQLLTIMGMWARSLQSMLLDNEDHGVEESRERSSGLALVII